MGIQLPSKYRLMTFPTFSMHPLLEKVLMLSTLRVGATFNVSLAPLSRLNVFCAAPSAYSRPLVIRLMRRFYSTEFFWDFRGNACMLYPFMPQKLRRHGNSEIPLCLSAHTLLKL